MPITSNPAASLRLMWATYAVGGFGAFMALYFLGAGNTEAAAAWVSAVAVGGSGLISFVRHSVFHRSDAARMGWDLGRRNEFQIEVGLANLAWGVVGIAAWALSWGIQAEGAVTIVFGLYLLFAAILHLADIGKSTDEGGHRYGPLIATFIFAAVLLIPGIAAVLA